MNLEDAHKARLAGKDKQALKLYQAAIEENPEDASAHGGLALSYYFLKQLDQATGAANQGLRLDPNELLARLALAYVHYSRKEVDAFREEIEKTYAANPEVYEAACGYALLLADQKDYSRAQPMLEQLAIARPERAWPRRTLGLMLYNQGQYKSALSQFIAAFRLQPDWQGAVHIFAAFTQSNKPLYWTASILTCLALIYLAFLSKPVLIAILLLNMAFFLVIGIKRAQERKWGRAAFDFLILSQLILVALWVVWSLIFPAR